MNPTSHHPRRAAGRRALFREVNERIYELSRSFATNAEQVALFCECGLPGCMDSIRIPRAAYALIRDEPGLFLVTAGHEEPGQELVVSERGYAVVSPASGEATAAPAA